MPHLEKEMLEEMLKYFETDIMILRSSINILVLNKKLYKKGNILEETENIEKRIEILTGKSNLAHNFVSFIKKYLNEINETQKD